MDDRLSERPLIAREKTGSTRAMALSLQFQINVHCFELLQAVGVLPASDKFRQWADGIEMANRMLKLLDEAGVLDAKLLDVIVAEFPTTRELPDSIDEPS